ncbi:MAG TPA: hypothetical protein VFN67_12145 [Polyangiales bacterium]|nr:hypothetical protein [Polyangiales bacterium]
MIELTWHRVWLCLGWLVLAAPSFTRAQPSAEEDAIYAYTDDRGRLVHVQRLQDVPMHLRRSARRVDVPDVAPEKSGKTDQLIEWLSGGLQPTQQEQPALYRYRGPRGRFVYTNLAASVPPDQRAQAHVDLSDVPLNSELGTALNQKLQERFDALRSGEACQQARAEAELPWWQRTWRDQRVAVCCGGVMLLLLLLTPFMHARGWGGAWARVLWTAGPMLGVVAVSASMLMKASGSLGALTAHAQHCEPGAFHAASGLKQRFNLVSALETEQQALAQIEQERR